MEHAVSAKLGSKQLTSLCGRPYTVRAPSFALQLWDSLSDDVRAELHRATLQAYWDGRRFPSKLQVQWDRLVLAFKSSARRRL